MNAGEENWDILVVDDDPSFLDVTTAFIEHHLPYNTTGVEKAEDALEILSTRREEIECVVSDYGMVGTDGIDLLDAVRKKYPKIPFILFTARGGEDVAVEAISKGVNGYVQKGGGMEQYSLLCSQIVECAEKTQQERHNAILKSAIANLPFSVVIHNSTEEVVIYANECSVANSGDNWETLFDSTSYKRIIDTVLLSIQKDNKWIGELSYSTGESNLIFATEQDNNIVMISICDDVVSDLISR